jgi:hypothetical protein
MAATMTTTPRSGEDTTPLSNNHVPFGARSATMTARSGDDANIGNNATTLDATLANNATPFGDNTTSTMAWVGEDDHS